MTDRRPTQFASSPAGASNERPVSAAAERALAEGAARRAEIDARVAALPPEQGARREREPVRYGDWETKGLASDF